MTQLILGVYILVAIAVFLVVIRELGVGDDVFDTAFALMYALLVALIWPGALPFAPIFGAAWVIQRRRKGEKVWPSSWWPSRSPR